MTKLAENNPQGTANIADDRVLPPVKTLKSFIKLCDRISSVDRDYMKGIMTDEQYELVGLIRASVQNELSELKALLP